LPPSRRVAFERVAIRAFRNLSAVEFVPAGRLNVIAGDNGQGKTSLIEALYVAATSRTFRSDKLRDVVQEGAEQALVRTVVLAESPGLAPLRHEQRALVGARARSFLIDGKKPKRLADYAVRTPIVVFHPGDLELANGPASRRRTLLDRVMLYLDPGGAAARLRYQEALKERQRLLSERGTSGADLDAYEVVLGQHGSRFAQGRQRAAEALLEALEPAFRRMAAPGLALVGEHAPGGLTDPARFSDELRARRARDLRRGAATFGPQRDDLLLALGGRPARTHASQGQQRILALALKMAELECVRAATGTQPILLLDDVSSELDPERTGAVYDFLRETESQVFVTTTRPELFVTPGLEAGERADWTLRGGALIP
jgi:DNA replication and repair protein RecF